MLYKNVLMKQVGVTLHACGVATDLVIKSCVENRSKFVIAPCCYGKLQVCLY